MTLYTIPCCLFEAPGHRASTLLELPFTMQPASSKKFYCMVTEKMFQNNMPSISTRNPLRRLEPAIAEVQTERATITGSVWPLTIL